MHRPGGYVVRVVSVGLVSVTLFCLAIWGLRWMVEVLRADNFLGHEILRVETAGLIPEKERDPNLARSSYAEVRVTEGVFVNAFGLVEDYASTDRLFLDNPVLYGSATDRLKVYCGPRESRSVIYFDKNEGLFVYGRTMRRREDWWGPTERGFEAISYAGRSGIGAQVEGLERFAEMPPAGVMLIDPNEGGRLGLIVFDAGQRRLLRYDFERGQMRRGEEMEEDAKHTIVQMGELWGDHWRPGVILEFSWIGPRVRRWVPEEPEPRRWPIVYGERDMPGQQIQYWVEGRGWVSPREIGRQEPAKAETEVSDESAVMVERVVPVAMETSFVWPMGGGFVPVLTADGTIHKLDVETFEFKGALGYLPGLGLEGIAKESPVLSQGQLLDYQVRPLFVDGKYRGILAASLGCTGDRVALAVFSASGLRMKQGVAYRNVKTLGHPGGPLLLACQYLVDNLNPPLLTLAGAGAVGRMEPTAGQRALFVAPNSLLSWWLSINSRRGWRERLLGIFLFMLPGVLLSGVLGWRVGRDGRQVGLSRRVRRWWVVATVLLGLPGYVTYRLTRPGVVQVSCRSCGRLRRPDFERCQHCGWGWQVAPGAACPSWRIVDEEVGVFAGQGEGDEGVERLAESGQEGESNQ